MRPDPPSVVPDSRIEVPIVRLSRWVVDVGTHAPTGRVLLLSHQEDDDAFGTELGHRVIEMAPSQAQALSIALARAADAMNSEAPAELDGGAP